MALADFILGFDGDQTTANSLENNIDIYPKDHIKSISTGKIGIVQRSMLSWDDLLVKWDDGSETVIDRLRDRKDLIKCFT